MCTILLRSGQLLFQQCVHGVAKTSFHKQKLSFESGCVPQSRTCVPRSIFTKKRTQSKVRKVQPLGIKLKEVNGSLAFIVPLGQMFKNRK